jgi:clan AA aspartic protease
MGLVFVDAEVQGPKGKSPVRFLVDSGAAYSVLPHTVWNAIGLTPERKMTFGLADGTEVSRGIAECLIRYGKHKGHSPVVLGAKGDEALLGAVTLEIFGLVLNPFARTLKPMRAILARVSTMPADRVRPCDAACSLPLPAELRR